MLASAGEIGQGRALPSFHRANRVLNPYLNIYFIGLDPSMPVLLLETLRGKQGRQRPVCLMRQAGRYLPECRALRAQKGGFLELAIDPVAAAEVTLQPIRRFGFDGAILFSDILMVPWALGQDLSFG